MIFTAVGDYLTQRRLPPNYEGFDEIAAWIQSGEARYFNLETTLHYEGECFGNSCHGGSYLRMDPEVLDDCKRYGFNMVSFCNNHSLDYCFDGLMHTWNHVQKSGLTHAGAGANLDQASAPGYLEAESGRVALIGFTSSCNDIADNVSIAGRQGYRVKGRPGVNQLRYKDTIIVTQAQMDVLKEIAEQTHVNAGEDIVRKEGYRDELPEGNLDITKNVHFRVGQEPGMERKCDPRDLARAEKAIYEAKLQADYILVAIHSHEISGTSKESPSQFLQEFAHFCIDCGADAIIGHGPHLLRPIEIYKGKPIFYSLGDFMLENENIPFVPVDYYDKYKLDQDCTMHELFRTRSKGFIRGLQTDAKMLETVIPRWEMQDGKVVKIELKPVELTRGLPRSRVGLPQPAKDDAILRRLAEMSEAFGTRMEIRDGIATVVLE